MALGGGNLSGFVSVSLLHTHTLTGVAGCSSFTSCVTLSLCNSFLLLFQFWKFLNTWPWQLYDMGMSVSLYDISKFGNHGIHSITISISSITDDTRVISVQNVHCECDCQWYIFGELHHWHWSFNCSDGHICGYNLTTTGWECRSSFETFLCGFNQQTERVSSKDDGQKFEFKFQLKVLVLISNTNML